MPRAPNAPRRVASRRCPYGSAKPSQLSTIAGPKGQGGSRDAPSLLPAGECGDGRNRGQSWEFSHRTRGQVPPRPPGWRRPGLSAHRPPVARSLVWVSVLPEDRQVPCPMGGPVQLAPTRSANRPLSAARPERASHSSHSGWTHDRGSVARRQATTTSLRSGPVPINVMGTRASSSKRSRYRRVAFGSCFSDVNPRIGSFQPSCSS
jgi:hypothetical protein